jgi:hypothetical protein
MSEVIEERRPPNSPAKIVKGPSENASNLTDDSLEQKITLRMEIMMKKEKLKQLEESNYTYRPKLYTNSARTTPKGSGKDTSSPTPGHNSSFSTSVGGDDASSMKENRFDKLYSDALKRHVTQNQKEENKDKDLTFTPKLAKRSTSRSSSRGGSRSASRERSAPRERSVDSRASGTSSSVNRNNSNSNNQERTGRQAATPTRTARKSIEPEKPSFQPQITKRAKSIERGREKEVSNRLYEHGIHVKEKMEKKRTEVEVKEMESCTFAPKIVETKRSSSASRLNVVERMSKFEEQRQKKLQEALEQKKETEKSFSFQPTLLAKGANTASLYNQQQQLPFHERLTVPQEKQISNAAAEALSQLTFQPQIVSKRAPSVSLSFLLILPLIHRVFL